MQQTKKERKLTKSGESEINERIYQLMQKHLKENGEYIGENHRYHDIRMAAHTWTDVYLFQNHISLLEGFTIL